MSTHNISQIRFKWKISPWLQPDKIRAIWLFEDAKKPEFYWEFENPLQEDLGIPPKSITNKGSQKNLVKIHDSSIIESLISQSESWNVRGGRGNALIVGEVSVKIKSNNYDFLLISEMRTWKSWIS